MNLGRKCGRVPSEECKEWIIRQKRVACAQASSKRAGCVCYVIIPWGRRLGCLLGGKGKGDWRCGS